MQNVKENFNKIWNDISEDLSLKSILHDSDTIVFITPEIAKCGHL